MITYAVKVKEEMKETNPRYEGTPVVNYYYYGKAGWIAGQWQYEGYATLKAAKIGLAAYKKQHEHDNKQEWRKTYGWVETIIGVVPMNGTEEIVEEKK